jgi:hypothetical protein
MSWNHWRFAGRQFPFHYMQIRAADSATTHANKDLSERGVRSLHIEIFKRIRFDGSWMLEQAGFHEAASMQGWKSESARIFPVPFNCNFWGRPRRMARAAIIRGLGLFESQPKCNTVSRAGQGRVRSDGSVFCSWNGGEVKTPTLPNQRVVHREKPTRFLGVDVPEWYHPTVSVRQQKKRGTVGHPPKLINDMWIRNIGPVDPEWSFVNA